MFICCIIGVLNILLIYLCAVIDKTTTVNENIPTKSNNVSSNCLIPKLLTTASNIKHSDTETAARKIFSHIFCNTAFFTVIPQLRSIPHRHLWSINLRFIIFEIKKIQSTKSNNCITLHINDTETMSIFCSLLTARTEITETSLLYCILRMSFSVSSYSSPTSVM